jgi:hypothetical protein
MMAARTSERDKAMIAGEGLLQLDSQLFSLGGRKREKRERERKGERERERKRRD